MPKFIFSFGLRAKIRKHKSRVPRKFSSGAHVSTASMAKSKARRSQAQESAAEECKQEVSPNQNATSLDTLPQEVMLHIVQYLPETDAINTRLVSRSWEAPGIDAFFRNTGIFHFRPTRDQLSRLEQLCRCPKFVRNIRSIIFRVGDFDEESLLRAWNVDGSKPLHEVEQMCSLLQTSIREDVAEQYTNEPLLIQLLSKLPNLRFVCVDGYQCPFPGAQEFARWKLMRLSQCIHDWRGFNLHGQAVSLERYKTCVLAALHYVTTVVLGVVPFDILQDLYEILRRRKGLTMIHKRTSKSPRRTLFPNIKALHIQALTGRIGPSSHTPYTDLKLPCQVVCLLDVFNNIQVLTLDFPVWCTVLVRNEFVSNFQHLHFPHLHSAFIGCLQIPPGDVRNWIYKHSSTLRNLAFLATREEFRQFLTKAVLAELRQNLKLKHFFFYAPDDAAVYIYPGHNWEEIPYDENIPFRNMKLVELYVTRKIDWPWIIQAGPNGVQRAFAAPQLQDLSHSQLMKMSMDEINARIHDTWQPPAPPAPPLPSQPGAAAGSAPASSAST